MSLQAKVLWLLGLVIVGAVFLQNRVGPVSRIGQLWPQISFFSARAGVEPALVAALVHAESSGNPLAGKSGGAVGLLQLTQAAAKDANGGKEVSEAELRRPERNLELGVFYLAQLKVRFGEERLALAAYRLGPTRLAREVEKARGPDHFLRNFHQHPAATYVAKVQNLKRLYARIH